MKYNYDKAVEYCSTLEFFEGYVPNLLRPAPFNSVKYFENLKEKGLYDEVLDKIEETINYDFQQKMEELVSFIEHYPDYKDVILEV